MRPLVSHCQFSLGKLFARTGRLEHARERLAIAATMYRDMGMTFWQETAGVEVKAVA
jgi:hypothetical protein